MIENYAYSTSGLWVTFKNQFIVHRMFADTCFAAEAVFLQSGCGYLCPANISSSRKYNDIHKPDDHMPVVVCKACCMEAAQCHMAPVDRSPPLHTRTAARQNSPASMEDIYRGDMAPHTCDFHTPACL